MKKFEFKSQICTTREQSERLLALGIKKETADMMYITSVVDGLGKWLPEEYRYYGLEIGEYHKPIGKGMLHIPAWSLHRLINLLPEEVVRNGYKFQLRKDVLFKIDDIDNVYDEVMGVIQRAIELDCFNKDYLEEKND